VIATAPVRRYATIDSTNLEAHRLHEAGESGPLWLLADEQTAGKGRLGRAWVSEKGNCYSTLILPLHSLGSVMAGPRPGHPDLDAGWAARRPPMTDVGGVSSVPQIGFVVALAVSDVVAQFAPNVQLKWPNDVLVDGAKISGILCEVLSPSPLTLAIGCGINVAHAPQGMNYPTTCIAKHANTNRDTVFDRYRSRLGYWLEVWNEGFGAVRETWKSRAIGISENVSIGEVQGIFEDLSEGGTLIIKSRDGKRHTVHAGDLTIHSLEQRRRKSA
jgi:BirA family transcriptional regulator, biotin operon repressor / biotin---[acetyl-CoA-carboxylase] ligase